MSSSLSRKSNKERVNRIPLTEIPEQHLIEYLHRSTGFDKSQLQSIASGCTDIEVMSKFISQILSRWNLQRVQAILSRIGIETQVLKGFELVNSYYRRKGISGSCDKILVWYIRGMSYSLRLS